MNIVKKRFCQTIRSNIAVNLSNKKCIPCKGGVEPMANDELHEYLRNLNDWELVPGNKEIKKAFKFKNFSKALYFVNEVGRIAESENHHPDIEFGWGYCCIRLSTHSIGGLHENDFIVAAKIDGIKNA